VHVAAVVRRMRTSTAHGWGGTDMSTPAYLHTREMSATMRGSCSMRLDHRTRFRFASVRSPNPDGLD
jgi:hypothetical protein